MTILVRALITGAVFACATLHTDPAAAFSGVEVPMASCLARNGTNVVTPPYGGPTPPDWEAAGQLFCFRFAAAHRPTGICPFDGRLCSEVVSCEVLEMNPEFIFGNGAPGAVLLKMREILFGTPGPVFDAGHRSGFSCTCPPFARLSADHRCFCNDGLVWDPSARSCTVPDNCAGGTAEGMCLPGPIKPGKDCIDCPPRGDVTGGTNPINIATGMKFQSETFYRPPTEHGLEIGTVFSSSTSTVGEPLRTGIFGRNRTSAFDRSIRDAGTLGSFGHAIATRPDGRRLDFRRSPGGLILTPDPDIADRLEFAFTGAGQWAGYRYLSAEADVVEAYNADGMLLFEEDRQGRRRLHTYADGSGGQASGFAGSQAFGYIAPICSAPAGWVYRVTAAGGDGGPLPAGKLMCATDHFGRQVHFQYDLRGRAIRAADPGGGTYGFFYDGPSGGCDSSLENRACSAGNLTSVTFPDQTLRVYHYNEQDKVNGGFACPGKAAFAPGRAHLPNHLTGLVDENGARYATWHYDCEGRALSSAHAGGAERITIAYDTPAQGQSSVSDYQVNAETVNQSRVYGFAVSHGVSRNTAVSHPNDRSGASASHTYDANGNIASRLDWNGNRTTFEYHLARNLQVVRVEGLTASGGKTAQTRTISTQWHPSLRLPIRIAEPLRITTLDYDVDGSKCGARGALCSKTVQATGDADGSLGHSAMPFGARAWRYTYNGNGSVLAVDGPRTDVSDVTTYTYHADDDPEPGRRGNMASVRNAAGHVMTVTAYNAHGQPTTLVDANGMITTLAYDARQRLISRSTGSETTGYGYDNAGQLTKVSLPDESFLAYAHDAARRLTSIEDNAGNRITYTLDVMGNRTHEEVRDAADQQAQVRSRIYDVSSRLFRDMGADKQASEFLYDDQGNLVSTKDPLDRVTSRRYDGLNRVHRVIDPALGIVEYAYNGLDAVTSVTDPRGLVTTYDVDGLGNLLRIVSPDTGTTINTYDAAGNLMSQTDAKAQVTRYTYDALNRVSSTLFHDGARHDYAYDEGPAARGRLSAIDERNAAGEVTSRIVYEHDGHGRVISETRTVNSVQYRIAYGYDSAGRLRTMTYPAGRSVDYELDALGRIAQVRTVKDGESQVVVQGVAYHPFGGVKSYVLGNGQAYSRAIDLDGRIVSYSLGNQSFGIGYDAAGRVDFVSELGDPKNSMSYGYDALDRLTSAAVPGTPYSYTYDPVGNRRTSTAGAGTHTYHYGPSANRLIGITTGSGIRSFVHDANGSTISDGINEYAYDSRGRMTSAASSTGATLYQVNALGQRVRKTNSAADSVFHYDLGGRLISETDSNGSVKREYIYLGDVPIGVVQ
jgi:YD repeat-containing protein